MSPKNESLNISINKITSTDFKCSICGTIIIFNTEDPSTYISKTDGENFFGTFLTTFRVPHIIVNSNRIQEEHVNVVIVDQNNAYRGHKDAYVNTTGKFVQQKEYSFINDINESCSKISHIYKLLIIFDRINKWAVDCYHIDQIKLTQLLLLLDKHIDEAEQVYTNIPNPLIVNIADQSYIIYNNKNIYVCCLLYIDYKLLEPFFTKLAHFYSENPNIIPNRGDILLTVYALENNTIIDCNNLFDISTNVLYDYTIVPDSQIQNDNDLAQLVLMIFNRSDIKITIPKEEFINFLKGIIPLKSILIKYPEKYDEVVHILNFLKKRRVISTIKTNK